MTNLDTLEQAQQDGRAPWTNVELDTRDFVVYNDMYPVTEGHTLVVPKTNHEDAILKCFNFAIGLPFARCKSNQRINTLNLFLLIL
mgnify:CR=1 FL=1